MRWNSIGAIACVVLLSACEKEATGQVAAVVNGEEITLQEVNAELMGAQIPPGASKEEAQQAALQNVINRRLMAQAAREEGIDETPEFFIRQRQLEDALLVQLLSQKLDRTAVVPGEREIDTFIKQNPETFANRTIFTVDRIQFPAAGNEAALKALADDQSMADVAATLKQMNIEFERGAGRMDSARVGQERLSKMLALPDGVPFIIREGGMVSVAVITGQQQAPIGGAEARPIALQAIRNKSLSDTLSQRLEREKAEAEIKFKEGLALKASTGDARGTTPAVK